MNKRSKAQRARGSRKAQRKWKRRVQECAVKQIYLEQKVAK